MDNKLLQAIWHHVPSFSVATIANAWHQILPLEPTPDSVVNSFGLAPVGLQIFKQNKILFQSNVRTTLPYLLELAPILNKHPPK